MTLFHGHHYWIIISLMKINVSIQETKIIVRRSSEFHLYTEASGDTRCTDMLNTQLPCIIAERAIHLSFSMDGLSFVQNQWNFLFTCYTMPYPLTKNVWCTIWQVCNGTIGVNWKIQTICLVIKCKGKFGLIQVLLVILLFISICCSQILDACGSCYVNQWHQHFFTRWCVKTWRKSNPMCIIGMLPHTYNNHMIVLMSMLTWDKQENRYIQLRILFFMENYLKSDFGECVTWKLPCLKKIDK